MELLLLFLSQLPPEPDTLVTVPARDLVDIIYAIAAGCVALTFFGVLFLMGNAFLLARNAARAMEEVQQKFTADAGIASLRQAAANAEAISATLRKEVAGLSVSVTHLSERLQQASDRMEERIEDFNALLEVVQGEAEDAFVDGASTARGVRAGLGSLASRQKKEVREGRPSSVEEGES
ncbi:MAG: hypothetical protein WD056_02075 [Gemmatimonadota bacterium]